MIVKLAQRYKLLSTIVLAFNLLGLLPPCPGVRATGGTLTVVEAKDMGKERIIMVTIITMKVGGALVPFSHEA